MIFDEDKLRNDEWVIEAYFALSHKAIHFKGDVSNAKKRKIFAGLKTNNKYAHFVLIGQLGKHIESQNNKSQITGNEILKLAFQVINMASGFIPINCVLIECKDNPKLRNLYEDFGFSFLQEDELVQMFRKI